MLLKTAFYLEEGSIFLVSELRPPLCWQRKTSVRAGFALFVDSKEVMEGLFGLDLKGTLSASAFSAWVQAATRAIFTTQISFFFPAGRRGDFEPFGFRTASNRQWCANSPQEHNFTGATSRLSPRL